MPKPARGGRRTATPPKIFTTASGQQMQWNVATQTFVPVQNQPAQNPSPQPQQNPQPAQDDEDENTLSATQSGETNPTFDAFQKMTDDEKADVINAALQEAPPSKFPDNATQRLVWYLGGDNKPTIVSDQQLDAMKGKSLYRQVAGIRDSKFGTNLTSQQIANQVMTGDITMYSNSGGSAYGRSIYFGASYSEIQNGYGKWGNIRGGNDSTMFRVKINPNARGMTDSQLSSLVSKEINSGSKLGKALRNVSPTDRGTVYALAKGIDYTHDGSHDYHMIYNRGCLVASSKLKHNANDNSW